MKKREKAQVTIFIIIAVVILGAVVIAIFVSKNGNNITNIEDRAKLNSVLGSIETCKELSADNSVIRIGLQGGYNNPPEDYLDFGWMFIPYYYIEGKTALISKAKIEENLAEIFNQNFKNCLEIIDSQGLDLKTTQSKTSVHITNSTIKFDIGMKFTLGNGEKISRYDLTKEPLIKNYKLDEMYEVAKYITDSHNQNTPTLCMNCLADMISQRGLLVGFMNIEKTTKLVIISEDINESNSFVYQFTEKYKEGDDLTGIPKIPQNGI